jgi:hypothetical protein
MNAMELMLLSWLDLFRRLDIILDKTDFGLIVVGVLLGVLLGVLWLLVLIALSDFS